jgi:hypothetical protein
MRPSAENQGSGPSGDPYCCLASLFDILAKIQSLSTSPGLRSGIIHEERFLVLRHLLRRLAGAGHAREDQITPMRRVMNSTSLISVLLFIFDILLGGSPAGLERTGHCRNELLKAQQRLVDHNVDKEGSPQKAWQVLMTETEFPQVKLHPRAWYLVELVNVVKNLTASTIDALSRLLLEYLLPGHFQHFEDPRHDELLLQMHFELDGLLDVP